MDFDADGDLDLIVGDEHGYINFFRRNSDGTLKTGEFIFLASGDTLDVGKNSAPCVYDYNNDGLLDLFIGKSSSSGGGIWLYLNSGTTTEAVFNTFSPVLVAGFPIFKRNIHPQILDINGDGLDDLLFVDQDGYTFYAENSGKTGAPIFAYMEKITVNGVLFRWPYMKRMPSLFVQDWDEDGTLDMLQGNQENFLYVFYGKNVAVNENSSPVASNAVTVLSNPVQGSIYFSITADQAMEASVELWSIDGRLVKTWNMRTIQGTTEYNRSISSLPAGVYTVLASVDRQITTARITILQ